MSDLPSFKHKPTCPKCTSGEIAFSYTDAQKIEEDDHRPSGRCGWTSEIHFGEHIHLKCTRCDYGEGDPWVMAIANERPTVGFAPRDPADSWRPTDSRPNQVHEGWKQ